MKSLRVLIADDNDQFLSLLSHFLTGFDRVEVVGLAHDGDEAIEGIQRFDPNLVIIDLNMPYQGPLKAPRAIKEKFPSVKVYLCSAHPEQTIQASVNLLRVDGFISKATLKDGLVSMVEKELSNA